MSDRHKPIAGELVPSPPPHAPTKPDARPLCKGCGGPEHGSVGVHIRCLEDHLASARARVVELNAVIADSLEALHKP
jgi:hypothetical protein